MHKHTHTLCNHFDDNCCHSHKDIPRQTAGKPDRGGRGGG